MASISSTMAEDGIRDPRSVPVTAAYGERSHGSAVSWAAIFAGAAAAAILSLLLLMLGTGFGLAAVSPWSNEGASATTFGVGAIIWVTITQLIASAMGGYLAGRLRTKWVGVHTDETYFRDTAHGFLAWAVASLATAAFLTSAVGTIVGGGAKAGATIAGGALQTMAAGTAAAGAAAAGSHGSDTANDGSNGAAAYFIDSLFRKNAGSADGSAAPAGAAADARAAEQAAGASTAEVTRIFLNSLGSGTALPPEDVRYVGQLVAQPTGLSQQEAEWRVSQTYDRMQTKLREAKDRAKEAADKARKASEYATLWLFISLLIGAFFASWAATYGGRRRDL